MFSRFLYIVQPFLLQLPVSHFFSLYFIYKCINSTYLKGMQQMTRAMREKMAMANLRFASHSHLLTLLACTTFFFIHISCCSLVCPTSTRTFSFILKNAHRILCRCTEKSSFKTHFKYIYTDNMCVMQATSNCLHSMCECNKDRENYVP